MTEASASLRHLPLALFAAPMGLGALGAPWWLGEALLLLAALHAARALRHPEALLAATAIVALVGLATLRAARAGAFLRPEGEFGRSRSQARSVARVGPRGQRAEGARASKPATSQCWSRAPRAVAVPREVRRRGGAGAV